MKSIMPLAALVAVAAAAALAAACGGVADDEITGGRRINRGGGTSASDPAADGTAASATEATQPAGADAPAPGAGPADGGTEAAAPPPAAPNAFTGAPAYVATTGTTSIRGAHSQFANNNPAKQDCMPCHDEFFAAGSVFKDAAGTMPAAQVEVRVRSANGNSVRAYTDAVGNFFITKSAATSAGVTLPAIVGARDATVTKPMLTTISSGACNTAACHAGNQGWAHVP